MPFHPILHLDPTSADPTPHRPSQVFTPAMDGSDMICRAKTGSGKTLAFALPVVEKIMAQKAAEGRGGKPFPRCLVLAPTRELAKQVRCAVLWYWAVWGRTAAVAQGRDQPAWPLFVQSD